MPGVWGLCGVLLLACCIVTLFVRAQTSATMGLFSCLGGGTPVDVPTTPPSRRTSGAIPSAGGMLPASPGQFSVVEMVEKDRFVALQKELEQTKSEVRKLAASLQDVQQAAQQAPSAEAAGVAQSTREIAAPSLQSQLQLAASERRADDAAALIEQLQQQRQALETEKQALEQQLSDASNLQQQLVAVQAAKQAAVEQLEAEKRSLQEQLATAAIDKQALEQQLAAGERAALQGNLSAAEAAKAAAEQQVSAVEASKKAIEEQLAMAQSQQAALSQQLTASEAAVCALEAKCAAAEAAAEGARTEAVSREVAQSDAAAARAAFADAQKAQAAADAKIQDLLAELATGKQQLQQLQDKEKESHAVIAAASEVCAAVFVHRSCVST